MAVEREKGYSFIGWKLGEEVILKKNRRKYTIIGFYERGSSELIAIDYQDSDYNISKSSHVSSYLKTDKDYFGVVNASEIEKIEDTTLEKLKQYDYERTAEKQEQIKVSKNNEYKQCKHYEEIEGIEPIEFIAKNKYGFSQGNIVKYNHRVGKKKGQEADDIIKIIDYAMLLSYEKGIEVKEDDVINLIKYRLSWIKERKNDR